VEYIVHKDNPIAAEDIIEINVPQFQQQTHERVINKEVLIERVVEVPVAVQQIVEVEVERKIEHAHYIEKLVEVRKNVDAVIEQRYDVIRENVIEVPVEKEIRVSVKTKRSAPVERQNYYENDVYVDSTVIVPVQGTETETNIEVNDADLEHRTHDNRSNLSVIQNENNYLRTELSKIEGKTHQAKSGQFNQVVTHNANLRAELSELESRLNIVQKDYERLLRVSQNKYVQHISYTVPDPRIEEARRQLESLLSENQRLISQVKVAPGRSSGIN